uniref:Ig-like domain-containing protein n=1 Tax=Neolamprologus brichardi TaxID=32507 RepID=A0A3Q4HM67_NEOBR
IQGQQKSIFCYKKALILTADLLPPISLTAVEPGDNVTLVCNVSGMEMKYFYWHKQPLGHMVQNVAKVIHGQSTISEEFKDSRFTVIKNASQYFLTIRNVSKEDEATYFCHTGTDYSPKFNHSNQKCVYVKQSPQRASVLLGHSVTLNCSLLSKNKETAVQCSDEHTVFWFRAGPEGFDLNIINTHRNSRDEDVKRSCVFSLSKTIQDSSDAGTYYCAVVTCGKILLGKGTQVETRPELEPVVLALGVLLACCVSVIAFLIFYIKQRSTTKEHCRGRLIHTHTHIYTYIYIWTAPPSQQS